MPGSNRAIATISANLKTDLTGWGSGLKKAGTDLDGWYAGIGKKINSINPLAGASKKIGDFGKGLASLGSSALSPLSGVAGAVGSIGSAATTAVVGVAAIGAAFVAAGVAGATAIGAMTASGIDRIDQLTDAAQRIGTTTEALSELRYAANLTGSSAEDLDAALEKLNQNLGDSVGKATPTSAALAKIGLSARDLAKDSPDAAFTKIVGAFEKIPDAATKASLATDIFGKGGAKLINTLSAGSGEIEKLREEAKKFGVSVSQVDAAKIAAAKDSMDRLGAAFEGVGNTLAIKLAPYIDTAAQKITEWFTSFWDGGKIVDTVLDGLGTGFGWLADTAVSMKITFQSVFGVIAEGFGNALVNLGSFTEGVGKIVPGLSGIGKSITGIGEGIAGMGRAQLEAAGKADQAFQMSKPSEGIAKTLGTWKKDASDAANEVASKVKETLGKGNADQLAGSVSEVTDKLKEQLATFGMTASEIEVYKLAQMGATKAQIDDVKALSEQITAKEKSKKVDDDLKSFAKSLTEKVKTPVEAYLADVAKINDAVSKGFLDPKDVDKAKAQSAKDAGLGGDVKLAGALDVNSSGGYSAIVNAMTGKDDGFSALERIQTQGNGILAQINNGIAQMIKMPKSDMVNMTG